MAEDESRISSPAYANIVDWVSKVESQRTNSTVDIIRLVSNAKKRKREPKPPRTPPHTTSAASTDNKPIDNRAARVGRNRRSTISMSSAVDAEDDLMISAKRRQQANQPRYTLPHATPIETEGSIFPLDSASQGNRDLDLCSSTVRSTLASTVTAKKIRELLNAGTPAFAFIGVSGRGGVIGGDEDEAWAPASIRLLVKNFQSLVNASGLICNCVEDSLKQHQPHYWWNDNNFNNQRCQEPGKHTLEANWVIERTTEAENLHSSSSEEGEWVQHALEIMRQVAGSRPQHHPATASRVTTVEMDRRCFPTIRNRRHIRSRSSSPRKKQRTSNSLVEESSLGILTARADIAVNLHIGSKRNAALVNRIKEQHGEFPTPFESIALYPLIAIECKSQDGSNLGAEFQSVLCANAILESWRYLGVLGPLEGVPADGFSKYQFRFPTAAIPSQDGELSGSARVVPIDHIIALQVISFTWSYSIILATPDGVPGVNTEFQRKVLGPFQIADSRTLTGAYIILRFLDALIDYKINVWLPQMAKRTRPTV
ncbi:hypothetical protein ABW19_dt0200850 [Dactylella cylindrospora]|nr:hypothetical protein ABW19_dt0200850 [Dactylella cylindrospora]